MKNFPKFAKRTRHFLTCCKSKALLCTIFIIFFQDGFTRPTSSSVSSTCLVCPQNDIFVSVDTWWTDQTINMCPGQNIWLENGASLTIWHCTIQLDPSQVGTWGGIKVQNGCKLTIVANSIIQDANEAIRGFNGFNDIRVISSTIINVESVIFAVNNSVPTSGTPVRFTNSTLKNRPNSTSPLVGTNGVNINLWKCTLQDLSSNFNVGINAYNNRVWLKNCNIYSFERCINKGIGGDVNHTGLIMDGCDIGSLPTISVFNNDIAVTGFNCIFVGGVFNIGKSMGSWERNNFYQYGTITQIAFPELSHTFYENRFGSSMNLLGAQNLTDARCNFWPFNGNAVNGTATTIKSDWGFNGVSSGNWHAQGLIPLMTISAGNDISNHYVNLAKEIFNYGGQFKGLESFEPFTCQQRWREIAMAANESDTLIYDDTANHSLWNAYNQSYQNAITQLNGADPSSNPELRCQLEDALVGMGQTVLKGILNSETIDATSLDTWSSRADPFVNIRAQIMNLFISESYTALSNYIIGLPLTGAEADDRDVFNNAVLWMKQAKEDEKDLYNLSSADLLILTNFANSSWGDYIAVLRGWLSINYNIFFNPPDDIGNLKGKQNNGIESQAVIEAQITSFYHEGCLTLLTNNEIKGMTDLEVISLEGKNLYSGKWNASNFGCIPLNLPLGIYYVRISNAELKNPVIKSIINK